MTDAEWGRLRRMEEALRFYAKHEHWMPLAATGSEGAGDRTLLIAHGNNEAFAASTDGWSMADWALRKV